MFELAEVTDSAEKTFRSLRCQSGKPMKKHLDFIPSYSQLWASQWNLLFQFKLEDRLQKWGSQISDIFPHFWEMGTESKEGSMYVLRKDGKTQFQ